jgi:diazepam-binding inhibitor (GABA receptor modulating acyl-CoA-binding protein)
MSNSSEFLAASQYVKKLTSHPTNEELLKLYGYYKQATVGNVNTSEPSFINVKEYHKWHAWNNNNGLSQYDAEVKYILYVNEMIQKYGIC